MKPNLGQTMGYISKLTSWVRLLHFLCLTSLTDIKRETMIKIFEKYCRRELNVIQRRVVISKL